MAHCLGARVVIEFHEVQDTGEQRIAPVRLYGKLFVPLLLRLAHGAVVHNEFDRHALEQNYRVNRLPVVMAPHGPYDQYGPLEVTHSRLKPRRLPSLVLRGDKAL